MVFKLKEAMNDYVVVEPFEKSAVLRSEEIATIFKVISIGKQVEIVGEFIDKEIKNKTITHKIFSYETGDLVIVTPKSVEKTLMGHQEVYYVRKSDIVGVVFNAE